MQMHVDNPLRVGRQDFRLRSAVWNLTDLDHEEAGGRARSQVGERERDGAGGIDFELEPRRSVPRGLYPPTSAAATRGKQE